eukprot:Platyproteum_vivax@DN10675_c0_g1_i1.p1
MKVKALISFSAVVLLWFLVFVSIQRNLDYAKVTKKSFKAFKSLIKTQSDEVSKNFSKDTSSQSEVKGKPQKILPSDGFLHRGNNDGKSLIGADPGNGRAMQDPPHKNSSATKDSAKETTPTNSEFLARGKPDDAPDKTTTTNKVKNNAT